MIKKMADENVKFRLAVSLLAQDKVLEKKLCLLLRNFHGGIIRFFESLVS